MMENNFFEKFHECYYYIIDNCIESTGYEKVFKLSSEGVSKLNEMAAILSDNSYHFETIYYNVSKKINKYVSRVKHYLKSRLDGDVNEDDILNRAGVKELWLELHEFVERQEDERYKRFFYEAFEFIFNLGPDYALNHSAITSEAGLRTHLDAQSQNIINLFIIMCVNEIFKTYRDGRTITEKYSANLSERMKSCDFASNVKRNNKEFHLWNSGCFVDIAMQSLNYAKLKSKISGIIEKLNPESLSNKFVYDVVSALNEFKGGTGHIENLLHKIFEINGVAASPEYDIKEITKALLSCYIKIKMQYGAKFTTDPEKLDEIKSVVYCKLVENILNIALAGTVYSVNLEYMKNALMLVIKESKIIKKIIELYCQTISFDENLNDGSESGDAGSKPDHELITMIIENSKDMNATGKLNEAEVIARHLISKYDDGDELKTIMTIIEVICTEVEKPEKFDENGKKIKGGINLLRSADAKNPINKSELKRILSGKISENELTKVDLYLKNIISILNFVIEGKQSKGLADVLYKIIGSLKKEITKIGKN